MKRIREKKYREEEEKEKIIETRGKEE